MEYSITYRIQKVIDHLGITPTEFADRIGMTQSAISQLLKGGRFPHEATLIKILKRYPLNQEWLVNGTGPMWKHDYFAMRFASAKDVDTLPEKMKQLLLLTEMTGGQLDRYVGMVRNYTSQVIRGIIAQPSEAYLKRYLDAFPALPRDYFKQKNRAHR